MKTGQLGKVGKEIPEEIPKAMARIQPKTETLEIVVSAPRTDNVRQETRAASCTM